MSRNYKRNRSGEEYKRLSLYLPADLADRIRAESEDRLESQNMVASRMLRDWTARVRMNCAVCEMMSWLNRLLERIRYEL